MNNIDSMMTMFDCIAENLKYEKICSFSSELKKEYNLLLNRLIDTNSSEASTKEKGTALEEISFFLLKNSGIFDVYGNVRTSTNELDQLVRVNEKGKLLKSKCIIDPRLEHFIGECKNYKSKVSVTYVGKLCSLLVTTQHKIGILFSYKGISGNNWDSSMGLIKKFYLSKEKAEERFCIIDFNIDDFISIKEGNNILQIISNKILSLQNDTNYAEFITPHMKSTEILNMQVKI